jgi:release factor glutamine methyltransferase
MRIKELRKIFHTELDSQYGATEVDEFFFRILEHYYGLKAVTLALDPEFCLTSEETPRVYNALDKLKKNVPLQYILGNADFYGLKFMVNKHVLIPRPETEELVHWILEDLQDNPTTQNVIFKVLDIGTGSGCIAISIAKNVSNSYVTAIDVSSKALQLAKKNAFELKASIQFKELDILNVADLNEKYHIIVSNPPYVRNLEKEQIHPNVLDHEPHIALFVPDDDPLIFYKKIGELALTNLEAGGALYFEINQYLGEALQKELRKMGFRKIRCRKDIFGKDRLLKVQL